MAIDPDAGREPLGTEIERAIAGAGLDPNLLNWYPHHSRDGGNWYYEVSEETSEDESDAILTAILAHLPPQITADYTGVGNGVTFVRAE